MLQFLRNNTKIFVWICVVIFGLLFGLSSISLRVTDHYAGEVFGKKISFQEYRAFETMTRLFAPSKAILDDPDIERQFTWQQIMLAREAKHQGIDVSDAEVKGQIDDLLSGTGSGPLSLQEYQHLLVGWHTTPHEFETGLREQIRIRKMISKKMVPSALPAAPATAAAAKQLADKMNDEKKKMQEDYVRWMSDIYARAKINDYSQRSNPVAAPAPPPASTNAAKH